ncbi:MAG: sugar ABC transporter substrate-binding protein [Candidatus Gastranaerophilales bacterium]|nr:sugar ABC transporter substrate-binding protein [Candidatus Gastranaerophilales bacterium]
MKRNLLILLFFTLISLTIYQSRLGLLTQQQKTVIQFISWGSKSEIEIIKPILADFEHQNPDIKVDFVHIPQNYFQKLHLLFASNLAPDVLFINNLYLPIYANAGVLEELNSRTVEQLNSFFYPKALHALSYNGKLYAIPRDVSTMVIFYNKDLFKKYSVPLPNKYWTFDDFLIIAKKLTKDISGDGKTDIWGVSFDENPLFYLPYLMSQGGGILSDDLKTVIINIPPSQKGLNFYADLRNKYHVAPTQAEAGSATMAQMFLQEQLAMQVSGRWLVPKYRTDAKFNWDVINFPAGDKGSIVPLDASGWAISKNSKHQEEAMRLINFLASKESIEKFTQSGLIVPARIDVARGKFLRSKNLPPKSEKVFIDVIKTAKPTPVSVNYNEIQDEIQEKTQYLFNKH